MSRGFQCCRAFCSQTSCVAGALCHMRRCPLDTPRLVRRQLLHTPCVLPLLSAKTLPSSSPFAPFRSGWLRRSLRTCPGLQHWTPGKARARSSGTSAIAQRARHIARLPPPRLPELGGTFRLLAALFRPSHLYRARCLDQSLPPRRTRTLSDWAKACWHEQGYGPHHGSRIGAEQEHDGVESASGDDAFGFPAADRMPSDSQVLLSTPL